jgi:predicted acetyltransferase
VHPDARGTGTATLLLRHVVEQMRARGQVLSSLYPTVPGLYRGLGWETVASLDETRFPTSALARVERSALQVRTAEPEEAPALADLFRQRSAAGNGGLLHEGRMWPGPPVLPQGDVVAVCTGTSTEDDGGPPAGYVAYDRGTGYDERSELVVRALVSTSREAMAALLGGLARWQPVAPSVLWHGPTHELALLVPVLLPPPSRVRPWMLRVIDPEGAVAARGWAADVDLELVLVDASGAEQPYRLRVAGGVGSLERGAPRSTRAVPRLHERGLALLWAGHPVDLVRRAGLLDGPLPGLETALAGPPPLLLDYF